MISKVDSPFSNAPQFMGYQSKSSTLFCRASTTLSLCNFPSVSSNTSFHHLRTAETGYNLVPPLGKKTVSLEAGLQLLSEITVSTKYELSVSIIISVKIYLLHFFWRARYGISTLSRSNTMSDVWRKYVRVTKRMRSLSLMCLQSLTLSYNSAGLCQRSIGIPSKRISQMAFALLGCP